MLCQTSGLASLQLTRLPQIAIRKEQTSDGKKQWWQKEPQFTKPGDCSWHVCAMAPAISGYTLKGEKILIWLIMAGSYRLPKLYIYPHRATQRPYPSEAKPACIPRAGGRAGVGREQMCGSSSTWALGDSATTTVLCQPPGTVLLGVAHFGAISPPVQVG